MSDGRRPRPRDRRGSLGTAGEAVVTTEAPIDFGAKSSCIAEEPPQAEVFLREFARAFELTRKSRDLQLEPHAFDFVRMHVPEEVTTSRMMPDTSARVRPPGVTRPDDRGHADAAMLPRTLAAISRS